ncbi:MAG: hypothetical protein IKE95_04855 [Methanobrevibacter sp.]|nr:hypothetical protein [Methanobrevibacter sp.]
MNIIILALLFFLSGIFMKLSDDFFDVNHDLKKASVFSVLCAITCGMAAISDIGASYIFIAILIGNLLAFKIDGIHHVIALILFIIIFLAWGIPNFSVVIALICITAALSDEVGHETIANITDNKFFNLFFEYRFVMKIIIFVLAVGGAFDISIFVCFLLFEIAYELAGKMFEKLN